MPTTPDARASQRGQAAVELVAVLPVLAVLLAAVWQVALVGHAAWSARAAAHAAARAAAVGGDARAAARAALPQRLERRLRVRTPGEGEAEVRLRVPVVLPALDLGSITARARFAPQA
ncbi:MAG TPA: TadE/TadG family type IV pilus assembly protein [Solirubrobacteraceae bacterium]|nr:TadE/TadG family type IV pilus assembly protein [Solirubrobacteraceae bacterium]